MYKKRSLESSETPVLYRGRTVPKGQTVNTSELSHSYWKWLEKKLYSNFAHKILALLLFVDILKTYKLGTENRVAGNKNNNKLLHYKA